MPGSLTEMRTRSLFITSAAQQSVMRGRPKSTLDPTRVPDRIFSGPGLPLNEQVLARLFGEC